MGGKWGLASGFGRVRDQLEGEQEVRLRGLNALLEYLDFIQTAASSQSF